MQAPSRLAEDERLFVQFPVCTIQTSVLELSERLQIPLASWVEPGMGKASGFGCRLASGSIVFLEEFDHARECLGAGPTIYVEASQLIEHGIEDTISRTIAGLSVQRQCVTWSQTEEGLEAAKLVVQAAIERRAKRENGA
jgi:hypothetical protein